MRHIAKYMKVMLPVAGAVIALAVATPGLAKPNDSSDDFCEDLREACDDANGTMLLCLETPTHLAECSGATDDDFERACTRFDPSCRLIEVTQLVVACACL